jgi:hypothetical protein
MRRVIKNFAVPTGQPQQPARAILARMYDHATHGRLTNRLMRGWQGNLLRGERYERQTLRLRMTSGGTRRNTSAAVALAGWPCTSPRLLLSIPGYQESVRADFASGSARPAFASPSPLGCSCAPSSARAPLSILLGVAVCSAGREDFLTSFSRPLFAPRSSVRSLYTLSRARAPSSLRGGLTIFSPTKDDE